MNYNVGDEVVYTAPVGSPRWKKVVEENNPYVVYQIGFIDKGENEHPHDIGFKKEGFRINGNSKFFAPPNYLEKTGR